MLWPQCNQRLGLDQVTRNQAQRVALNNGSQDQLCLHHSKAAANAHAGPTAEWKVGVVRATGRTLRSETLRIKLLWILPKSGMAMRRIGAQQDHAVFRNVITTQFVIGNDFPAEDPGWRIEPQRYYFVAHLLIVHSLTCFLVAYR